MHIRNAHQNDLNALYDLYREVAKNERGIARSYEEITLELIENIFQLTDNKGIVLVGVLADSDKIIAKIHAETYGMKIFDHVLTHVTVVVHPEFQGKGFGRNIIQEFIDEIENNRPEILRIELEARASNQSAICLYESLGFKKEGVLKNKTRNTDGNFEDSIQMAWLRPSIDSDLII